MRIKLLFYFTVFFILSLTVNAQLTLSSTSNGVVTVNYNSADFSLYDPQYDPVQLYVWIDTGQNSTATYYQDEWTNSASLTTLAWNGTDAHVGTLDLNIHDFMNSGGVITSGTIVSNFNLILRNPAGDRQSSNLLASDYGYTASTLTQEDIPVVSTVMIYPNPVNTVFTSNKRFNRLDIYNILGKRTKTFKNNGTKEYDISDLSKGVYFLKGYDENGIDYKTLKLVKK